MWLVEVHRRFKRRWDSLRRRPLEQDYAAMLARPDAKDRFEFIYRKNIWARIAKDNESASGGGSTLAATETFRRELETFLSDTGSGVLFDAPCGDFHFMRSVRLPAGWQCIGADVSPSAITAAKSVAPDTQFMEFDLTKDEFPRAEVWLCRACLFHLSFGDIRQVLTNFTRSQIPFAIITSHLNVAANRDITTGDYRPLDLTAAPFCLPKPKRELRDIGDDITPWIAGVWTRDEITAALSATRP